MKSVWVKLLLLFILFFQSYFLLLLLATSTSDIPACFLAGVGIKKRGVQFIVAIEKRTLEKESMCSVQIREIPSTGSWVSRRSDVFVFHLPIFYRQFPTGYYGHSRAKSRIDLCDYYRQLARPEPPKKFLERQNVGVIFFLSLSVKHRSDLTVEWSDYTSVLSTW